MRPLDLNLSSRPFRNNTLLWAGFALAFAAVAGFSAWNFFSYRSDAAQISALRERVSSIEDQKRDLQQRDQSARRAIEKFDLDMLGIQADKANEVIEWKAFSWTRFFNVMEELMPWEIKMTSIRPVFRGEAAASGGARRANSRDVPIAVEGVARNYEAFSKFERVLLDDPRFPRVEPERLRKIDTGEMGFRMTFLYATEGPPAAPEPPSVDADAGAEAAAAGLEEQAGAVPVEIPSVDDGTDGVDEAVGATREDAAGGDPAAPPADPVDAQGQVTASLPGALEPGTDPS